MTNFASIESSLAVASLVLNFDTDVCGKTVANIAVHDFAENYRGDDWGYNGPGVITRALQKMCNTDTVSRCGEFQFIQFLLIMKYSS